MLQVGVNAPGTAKSTTLRPEKIVSVDTFCVPSAVIIRKSDCGSLSPTLIAIGLCPCLVCGNVHLIHGDFLFKRQARADHRDLERRALEAPRIRRSGDRDAVDPRPGRSSGA